MHHRLTAIINRKAKTPHFLEQTNIRNGPEYDYTDYSKYSYFFHNTAFYFLHIDLCHVSASTVASLLDANDTEQL